MMPSPLREIDPDQPKRLHTFGNPFKQDKKVIQFSYTQVSLLSISSFHCVMFSSVCWSQGMMIDEADEFVAGPQNKKRGNSSDSISGATVKRRRSMSPLLRRPQSPSVNTNHVVIGKNLAGVQGQQNLLKLVPQHKGKI